MSKLIPLDRIDHSPWFKGNDEQNVAELVEDIEKHGMHTPVILYPRGDRFEMVTGHDRLEAHRRMGRSEIVADVRSTLVDDDARLSLFNRDNNRRKSNDALKRAGCREYYTLHPTASTREVAMMIGCSNKLAHEIRQEMVAAGHEFPGAVDGRDGKTYTTDSDATCYPVTPDESEDQGEADPPSTTPGADEGRGPTGVAPTNGNGKRKVGSHRLRLNDGETAEQYARRGMAIEATGGGVNAVASELRTSGTTYQKMRLIVQLADDAEHLTAADAERARAALESINSGKSLKPAYESIKGIALRRYGSTKNQGKGLVSHLQKRLDAMERAVVTVCASCQALEHVVIPAGVPSDKRNEWLHELEDATKALQQFRKHVKEA